MDENLIIENRILKGYKEKLIQTVNIPEGVSAIAENAFADFPNLYSIDFPKSLVIIGDGAFRNCPKLKSIDLENIVTLGAEAFLGCTVLQSVTFGNKLTYLPNAVFLGCTLLDNIELPENVTYIGCECFRDCTSLSVITFDGIMEIDNNAFEGCDSLCNIVIPKNALHISSDTFSFCQKLDTVKIENRFIDIDEKAFENSVNFTIHSSQNSAAHRYAKNNRYRFHPAIIENDYRTVTQAEMEKIAQSGIMFLAKKAENDKDEFVIKYDKSANERINNLIGVKKNVQ